MEKLKDILSRLTNTSTLISVVAAVILIAQTMGYQVNSEKLTIIINAICVIGISLGVMSREGRNSLKWDK